MAECRALRNVACRRVIAHEIGPFRPDGKAGPRRAGGGVLDGAPLGASGKSPGGQLSACKRRSVLWLSWRSEGSRGLTEWPHQQRGLISRWRRHGHDHAPRGREHYSLSAGGAKVLLADSPPCAISRGLASPMYDYVQFKNGTLYEDFLTDTPLVTGKMALEISGSNPHRNRTGNPTRWRVNTLPSSRPGRRRRRQA